MTLDASSRLRAALFTLGDNLEVKPHSFGAQLFSLADDRRVHATSMERSLSSGPEIATAILAAKGLTNPITFDDIRRLHWPPISRGDRPEAFELLDHALGWIADAQDALRSGGGSELAVASGGALTAAMVGADLREVFRLLTEFAEAMEQPAPLPGHVPGQVAAAAARFMRAAELLTSANDIGFKGDSAAAAVGTPPPIRPKLRRPSPWKITLLRSPARTGRSASRRVSCWSPR